VYRGGNEASDERASNAEVEKLSLFGRIGLLLNWGLSPMSFR